MAKKNFKGVLFGDETPETKSAAENLEDMVIQQEKITILPELDNLIPPLSDEELSNLEASIKEEGCRDPLIIWVNNGDHVLVDGHNRYRICKHHNIPFRVKAKEFIDILDVKNWMLGNQMSRRNLSSLQMSYLRGLRYETEKLSVGRQKADDIKTGQNDQINLLTSEKLAEEYSVGEKTIRRDAKFTKGLNRFSGQNQQIRWGILNGQIQAKKQTVAELADQDDDFLEQLRMKLEETANLNQAMKLLLALENESSVPESVPEAQALCKNLTSKLKKAAKLKKGDPVKKEMVKEIKSLFTQYMKLIN
jgi:hypothetical protein